MYKIVLPLANYIAIVIMQNNSINLKFRNHLEKGKPLYERNMLARQGRLHTEYPKVTRTRLSTGCPKRNEPAIINANATVSL